MKLRTLNKISVPELQKLYSKDKGFPSKELVDEFDIDKCSFHELPAKLSLGLVTATGRLDLNDPRVFEALSAGLKKGDGTCAFTAEELGDAPGDTVLVLILLFNKATNHFASKKK